MLYSQYPYILLQLEKLPENRFRQGTGKDPVQERT
jgi:hypothetical protein